MSVIYDFQATVWSAYKKYGRDLPWRKRLDPYGILVSEMMLQQTQVNRVADKFTAFTERFESVFRLAEAPLSDVLAQWNGLGYNRRAKFLWQAASQVVQLHDGQVPQTLKELVALPGIGPNTAAAILVYAHNLPLPFVETNVRTVYFYHFFADQTKVEDKELLSVVAATMDQDRPREWFWALMDYGALLKKQGIGQLDKSAHYKKQSQFRGSLREMRGRIIRALLPGRMDQSQIEHAAQADNRFARALEALIEEGIVAQSGRYFHLTSYVSDLDNNKI